MSPVPDPMLRATPSKARMVSAFPLPAAHPVPNAGEMARVLLEHDADRMECMDHDGLCCPSCDAHDFQSGYEHQAAALRTALLGPDVVWQGDGVRAVASGVVAVDDEEEGL